MSFSGAVMSLVFPALVAQAGGLGPSPQPLEGNPVPDYPEKARYALIVGDVWFRAQVDETGAVVSVEITRVPREEMGFEEAVREAVKKWRFEPAVVAGRAVAAAFEGNVRFHLKPEEEERIYDLSDRAAMAWNRRDSQVLASLFADGAHLHTVTEDAARGPAAIRARFADLLSGPLRGTHISLGIDMIRFFAPDRAELEQTFEIRGEALGSKTGRLSSTLQRVDGQWLIDHARVRAEHLRLWDTDPVVKFRPPEPASPPEAVQNGVEGRVILEILVGRDGSTEVVSVLEELPYGCVEAAIENARLWRWEPALRNGVPVEAQGVVWIRFGSAEARH